jgi:hypothetical protein
MKRSRYTEEQIIGILKEHQARPEPHGLEIAPLRGPALGADLL